MSPVVDDLVGQCSIRYHFRCHFRLQSAGEETYNSDYAVPKSLIRCPCGKGPNDYESDESPFLFDFNTARAVSASCRSSPLRFWYACWPARRPSGTTTRRLE